MAQSLHQKYSHLVFSTGDRRPLITDEIEPRLYEYMGGIVRDLQGSLVEINGIADHVHLILRDSKLVADVEFIKALKGSSSSWVNQNFDNPGRFSWQAGYGWFSVGSSDLERARAYVQNQKSHHQSVSFKDEFRKFLIQYGVEYDERYVWE